MKNNTQFRKPYYIIIPFMVACIIISIVIFSLVNKSPSYSQEKTIYILPSHEIGIRLITFTNSSSNIITFGYDGNIIKWDLSNLCKINSVKFLKNNVISTSFTSDKEFMCVGFSDGYVSFVNLQNLTIDKTFTLPKNNKINSVGLTDDRKYFIVVEEENIMKIYSYQNGTLLKTISNEEISPYIPNIDLRNRIAVFFKMNEVILYSLHNYQILKKIHLPDEEVIYDTVFSYDGKSLFVGGELGKIYKIDIGFSYNTSTIHKDENQKWIRDLDVDSSNNVVYITNDNDVYYINTNENYSYKLFEHDRDILTIDIEKFGRYFACADMNNLYIIPIQY